MWSQSCVEKLPGDLAMENERTESEMASGLQATASGRDGVVSTPNGKGREVGRLGRDREIRANTLLRCNVKFPLEM